MLLGKRLPPYGQNAERAKAWGMACMRPSERSLSHDIAQERAVKMAEELAAAAARTGGLSVCARVPLQHALAAWDAPRHQTCREGAGTKSRRIELVDCRSVRLHPCAKSKRRVRASGATCVARVLRPVVRDTKFIAIRPARA